MLMLGRAVVSLGDGDSSGLEEAVPLEVCTSTPWGLRQAEWGEKDISVRKELHGDAEINFPLFYSVLHRN